MAPLLLLAAVFGIWWFIAERQLVANYLVPRPVQVWETLTGQWDFLVKRSLITLYETVVGFVLAALIGLITAVAIAYSRSMEKALYPIVLFAQVIPKIAIAPLLIVWFGADNLNSKIIVAVLIAFYPVVISGVAGLRSTDPGLLDLSATMGASAWQTFRKIRFPNALPHLMAGLKEVAVILRTFPIDLPAERRYAQVRSDPRFDRLASEVRALLGSSGP